jgi:hypothetical protein
VGAGKIRWNVAGHRSGAQNAGWHRLVGQFAGVLTGRRVALLLEPVTWTVG